MSNSAPLPMKSRDRELARLILINLRSVCADLDAGIETWQWPVLLPAMSEAIQSGVEILVEKGGYRHGKEVAA